MHFYQKNIADFNNATRHLTRVERSLYSDAIELYYDTEKPLISDFDRLSRLLLAHSDEEKTALKNILSEFFTLTDEGYFNKRCNEEILKYQEYMQSKSRAGKASAEQRAKQKATRVEQVLNTGLTGEQLTNTQYPITINHNKTLTPKINFGFEQFWNAYPKKVGKGDALKAFEKIKDKTVLPSILSALSWQRESDQWKKDAGQFIPNPSTYLNQQRWLDEPPPDPYAAFIGSSQIFEKDVTHG